MILASPATLIGLLRAVAYGWSEERIARNAEEVGRLGRELNERLGTLGGHFDELRRGLDRAVAAYNGAMASFESRVLVSARRFQALGVAGEEVAAPEAIERRARAVPAASEAQP